MITVVDFWILLYYDKKTGSSHLTLNASYVSRSEHYIEPTHDKHKHAHKLMHTAITTKPRRTLLKSKAREMWKTNVKVTIQLKFCLKSRTSNLRIIFFINVRGFRTKKKPHKQTKK